MITKRISSLIFVVMIFVLMVTCADASENEMIAFNKENWQFYGGKVVDQAGRKSLMGIAELKGVVFENGIIEFDLFVTGKRSYPGIRFRATSRSSAENIYIRPHIIGVFDTALQYTPIFNNEACWQLYNGDGFTSGIGIPLNEWVHFKLEVLGTRARVFLGESKNPVLKIDQLKHEIRSGGIALISPADGSAYFSNFKINTSTKSEFDTPELEPTPPGLITDWEISQPFKYTKINLEKNYNDQNLGEIKWQKVIPEQSGLVTVSRYIQRRGREPDFIFARTIIDSDSNKKMEFKFGYSDWVTIFLNGEQLFSGSSPYKGRGSIFQGIIGLYDSVFLPLEKGRNEIVMLVGESFGGWGFMGQDGKAVYMDKNLKKLWESEKVFNTSESVIYDPKREVLYVSNFDQFNMGNPNARQFISKVTLKGEVKNLKWVDGLDNPLGMKIYKDNLFVAERHAIAQIDLNDGKVVKRYKIPGSVFLNDITIDKKGRIYITDSRKNVIWRFADGKADEWLKGAEVSDPNVIYFHKNRILFGNSDDRSLKSVDPNTKEVKTIAKFEKGFIDGIKIDNDGNYLISLWHGILYRVTPDGMVTKILDTSVTGTFSADFEYIKEKNLLLIPTFFGNTIAAYNLGI